ncbi:glycosyltransferase family 4 protein [Acinetobacter radioresistens]|uniref:glycosyltransferase family 4 protein n=1 Tax=Acinetobacter radioresistens TaxID=40216 RepID=UPI0021CD9F69|nr:glycosyltransferase family 4 protein [Acinetobacter radioresistens]MCU4308168.1 glycosyltransferase family 4 protein [Acinetobacter radioresistens]
MKNICFLVGNLNLAGGTEKVTTILASNLDKTKYNVFILNIFDGTKPFFDLDVDVKNSFLFSEPVSLKTNLIKIIKKLRSYLRSNSINTLVVVDSISCVFTIPSVMGLEVKHICWEHFNYNNDMGVLTRRMGRYFAALFSDEIITLTNRDVDYWKNNLPVRNHIIAIPNPAPFDINTTISPKFSNRIVLAIGRLSYEKGYDLLLESWSIVNKSATDWSLILVGDGPEMIKLKHLAQDLGILDSVSFVGRQNNVEIYYKKASIFCLSSRFEGFPMVLVEAQCFGLPVVAFDCDTGPSEIVNEKNGRLVENGNVKDLSKNILELINLNNDDYCDLIKNSKLNVSKYSLEKILKYWELLL